MLKHLNRYAFTNIATLISFTKLYNEFKSNGFKLSKDTIFNYMGYLEDAYAIFTVPIYRNSIKEEQCNPKKLYAIDNGFKKIHDYAARKDMSKLYENVVFLSLRRLTKEVYYYKEHHEVDFFAKIKGVAYLINVSYRIDGDKTYKREIDGLLDAMEYFHLDEAYLITQNQSQIVTLGQKRIHIIPLYAWLLR